MTKGETRFLATDRSERLGAALQLIALWNLAIAQPTLDLLSRQATFLVAHQLRPFELVGLAIGLSWLLPAALLGVESLIGLASSRAARGLRVVLVLVLMALLGLLAFEELSPLPAVVVISGTVVLALLGVAAYLRVKNFRSFLSILAVSALVVPGAFLFDESIRDLVFPPDAERTATKEKASPATTPVVMIVFDALPLMSLMNGNGEIVRDRYPAFWSLARDAHWFRNATTVHDETRYALPALLTGKYPSRGRAPARAHYPRNLFALLSDRYQICAVEQYSQMSPPGLCPQGSATGQPSWREKAAAVASDLRIVYLHLILPEELATSLPDVRTRWNRFARPSRADQNGAQPGGGGIQSSFARFVGAMGDQSPRTFHFFHVLLPHVPWMFSPSGKVYGRLHEPDEPEGAQDDVWGNDEWLILQGLQRHLLQLGYADELLAEALERLREVGMYDRALIVVTADHGASFRSGDLRRGISPTNYHEILPVPLFIKLPGQTRGVIHDENAEIIDLVPTLAGILGLDPGWDFDGRDLLAEGSEPRERKVFLDVERARALPLADRIERKFDSARYIEEHFGTNWESLHRVGPDPGLVGRRPESLSLEPDPAGRVYRVELEQAWLLRDLDLQDGYLPLRLHGVVSSEPSGPMEGPLEIAIAINGRIRAVTRSVPGEPESNGDRLAFSAMVPESCLRDGRNDVRVFLVADGGQRLIYAHLLDRETYFLDAASEFISSSSGARYRIEPTAVQGGFWSSATGVQGWAADIKRRAPAERIVIFSGEEFVSVTELHFQAPGLAERLGTQELLDSGFRALVPSQAMQGPRPLRVFALLDSRASGLPFVDATTGSAP